MSNSSLDVGYGVGSAAEQDQIADIPSVRHREEETLSTVHDSKIICEEFMFFLLDWTLQATQGQFHLIRDIRVPVITWLFRGGKP